MEPEITITCEELVKPSSLTPNHLRFYPLSFLDQLAPPIFMPFLFFYDNKKTNLSNKEQVDQLKTSLSKILSLFYPMAGRIKNNTEVECNDEGVRFVEAKAGCKMLEVLENPNPNDLNKFLAFKSRDVTHVPVTVQLTFFDCGGLVVGVGVSHKLCDALSALMFIKSWAGFARGETHELVKNPSFDLAKVFPPSDVGDYNIADSHLPTITKGEMKETIVTKRFVFLKPSLDSLRQRFSRNNKDFDATRVEALSGFITSRFAASKADKEIDNMYTVIHPVNLRKYINQETQENMFGNIVMISGTFPQRFKDFKDDEGIRVLVQQIREGIRKIDAEYVKKIQENAKEHLEILMKESSGFVNREIVTIPFTSLCRFPVYEADFGLGKPLWVSSANMGYKNLIAFFDTKEGDGIEVWVNMEEKDMLKFEVDEELLSYVSLNPNVSV